MAMMDKGKGKANRKPNFQLDETTLAYYKGPSMLTHIFGIYDNISIIKILKNNDKTCSNVVYL